jgi:hypothetical protein
MIEMMTVEARNINTLTPEHIESVIPHLQL